MRTLSDKNYALNFLMLLTCLFQIREKLHAMSGIDFAASKLVHLTVI